MDKEALQSGLYAKYLKLKWTLSSWGARKAILDETVEDIVRNAWPASVERLLSSQGC